MSVTKFGDEVIELCTKYKPESGQDAINKASRLLAAGLAVADTSNMHMKADLTLNGYQATDLVHGLLWLVSTKLHADNVPKFCAVIGDLITAKLENAPEIEPTEVSIQLCKLAARVSAAILRKAAHQAPDPAAQDELSDTISREFVTALINVTVKVMSGEPATKPR